MKFVGGCRHGTEVPKQLQDGRSTLVVEAPKASWALPEACEYRLAVWRHADGTSEFFYCSRALRSDAAIDTAARPLLQRSPSGEMLSGWGDLYG